MSGIFYVRTCEVVNITIYKMSMHVGSIKDTEIMLTRRFEINVKLQKVEKLNISLAAGVRG